MNKKRSIYILLSDTGTIFTKTIKLYTKEKYNHSSLALHKEFGEIYSFGRKNPVNPFRAGFIDENDTMIYSHFSNTTCVVLRLDVDNYTYEKICNTVSEFKNTRNDYSYNLLGFIGILVDIPIKRNNAYFCSQFVSEVLEKSGVMLFDIPSELVTPTDFLNCSALKMVFQGRLLDYAGNLDHRDVITKNGKIIDKIKFKIFGFGKKMVQTR